jgi:hypothetical protein
MLRVQTVGRIRRERYRHGSPPDVSFTGATVTAGLFLLQHRPALGADGRLYLVGEQRQQPW